MANALVFAPFSKGLAYDEESSDEIYYTPLLTTSSEAFSKVNITDSSNYDKAAEDIDGPFVVSLEAEKSTGDASISHAFLVGGETLFTGIGNEGSQGINAKLFGSMISELADHETPVAVPVKSLAMTNLVFKAQTAYITALLCVIVIPLVTLVTGLVIWLRRRRR